MTFAINIDAARWQQAQAKVINDYNLGQELIAVIKSNGYGIGQNNLAKAAQSHGLSRIAVGTVYEVAEIAFDFTGEIVVLEPINPLDLAAWQTWLSLKESTFADRLIMTIADSDSLDAVKVSFSNPAAVFEIRTEMNRFGNYAGSGNWIGTTDLSGVSARGLTAHFPTTPNPGEVEIILNFANENVDRFNHEIAISHVTATDFKAYQNRYPNINIRLRSGTAFWLGDRGALRATATVLAVHKTIGTTTAGYQKHKTLRDFIVVSGGTSHGIGLSAPSSNRDFRTRINGMGVGLLGGLNRYPSPFRYESQKLWFVEPPHQHVSMLFVDDANQFRVGMELEVEVRFTTTRADVVRGLDF